MNTESQDYWRTRFGVDDDGAVDMSRCSMKACRHGVCDRCGYPMHSAIHGPVNGGEPGSRPFGHRFVSEAK